MGQFFPVVVVFGAVARYFDDHPRIGDVRFLVGISLSGSAHHRSVRIGGKSGRLDANAQVRREYPTAAPAYLLPQLTNYFCRDATEVDFGDPKVQFMTMPGTADREAVLVVQTASGTTVVLNDLIFDLANRAGLSGWLFKAIGLTGDQPHIPFPVKLKEVQDKQAVSTQLERWARMPNLERVIISHGDIIAEAPGAVLDRIARELRA